MARKKFTRAKEAPPTPEPEETAPDWATASIPTDCPLCGRPLAEPMNRHHLIPVSQGGRHTTTVMLHKICHDKIHSVLTEKELKRSYPSIETLQAHEEIARFIAWVQKKEPEYYDKSARDARKA